MEQEVGIYSAPKTVIDCFRITWTGRTGLGGAMKERSSPFSVPTNGGLTASAIVS
jgi:hypothetical protein